MHVNQLNVQLLLRFHAWKRIHVDTDVEDLKMKKNACLVLMKNVLELNLTRNARMELESCFKVLILIVIVESASLVD